MSVTLGGQREVYWCWAAGMHELTEQIRDILSKLPVGAEVDVSTVAWPQETQDLGESFGDCGHGVIATTNKQKTSVTTVTLMATIIATW